VQQGWVNEFLNFKKNVYRGKSDYLPDSLDRKNNLYEWLQSGVTETNIPLLRHTSFSRPAFSVVTIYRKHGNNFVHIGMKLQAYVCLPIYPRSLTMITAISLIWLLPKRSNKS
jgi:hypothetical protein